jgi:hypothetical protein
MTRTKLFLACALAFAVSLTATTAAAQAPTNQITYFTFSAPFELPGGKTLPAGKYVFKIVDSPSNRHIVQVMSEDQQTMHATLMAIPAERNEPASEPEVRFMEAEANAAPAVRTWWYPGRSIGHEFIYPKDHARRLAARQSEGVLTTAGDASGDEAMRTGDLARIGADGRETAQTTTANTTAANTNAANQTAANNTAAQTTTSSASTPAEAPAQPATPEPAARAAATEPTAQQAPAQTAQPGTERTAPMTAERSERTELPRTASALPLIGLMGLASLLGAGALRLRSDR